MTLLFAILCLSMIFALINGFHDSANSIATVISTKVLSPFQAVLLAAFFNFIAYWVFKLNVADTVAKVADTMQINLLVIFCGVLAAIIWNLITWWFGIPSSSSHTLIGGFAGAAMAHAGFGVVNIAVITKIILFIFLAPVIGMFIALIVSIVFTHIFKKTRVHKAERWFRRLQIASCSMLSLGHGGNDAQNIMGIIAAAVIVYIFQVHGTPDSVPNWLHINYIVHAGKISIKRLPEWIPFSCYSAMAIGTMMGGSRIIKTMGTRITKVTPFEGVSSEFAGSITLFITQALGIPVSTTHTITGSIMGVGAVKRISAVRWGVTRTLVWAWILTIPVSALIAALLFWVINLFI